MLLVASYLADNARPTYERITRYLADRTGEAAEVSSAGWEERVGLLDAGRVDVGFLCGLPYSERADRPAPPLELLCAPVMAAPRYGGGPVYFTDVIVRRDSSVRRFADLRGKSWAYNGPESFSGFVVVRHHLLGLGETPEYFGSELVSGSHQMSIERVVAGDVDASGIDSTVLEVEQARHPGLAARLRVVETIGPSPIPPVVTSRRLDARRRSRLRALFLAMHEDPAGRDILAAGLLSRFVPVRDADYDPVRTAFRAVRAAGFLGPG